MAQQDGALITGRSSHEVYVIENGKRRWVPDAWTMQTKGLSPASLVMVDDAELDAIPLGDPLPSEVPPPKLENGAIVESESGVYRMDDGQLKKVLDPRRLMLIDGFKPESVTYLPDSLIRGLFGQAFVSDLR